MPAAGRPGGVSVLAGDDVREAAVVHLEELLPQLPSLSWAGASSRPRYFQLRGIGELEQYQGAPNPSVGFLVDEIDFSGIGMIASTFDVEQVEVLRGPQGTRYGANALGGLIKVKTRDPVPVRELDTELSLGGDGLWSAGAAAGGALPAGDSTQGAWRAVLERAVSDGFRENRYLGRDDTNGRDETTARLKFRLESEHGWRADLALLHADFDNGYDAFAIDNSFTTLSDRPGKDSQRSDGASLDLAHAAAGGRRTAVDHGLGGIGHRREFRRRLGQRARLGRGRALRLFLRHAAQATDAVRGPAPVERGGRRHFVDRGPVAAAPRGGRTTYPTTASISRTPSCANSRATTARRAPRSMGRRTLPSAPATTVTAGLRVEEREARYDDSDGVAFDPRDRLWGGELSVTHRVAETQSLWATLARGYRAGGFNIGTSVPADRQQFASEYLWSAEAGWKGADAAGDRRADVNLYYMRREHPQVSTSLQLDPEDPLTFIYLTDNADSGEAWGLESSATVLAGERFELAAMLSWMESRYHGYRFGDRDLEGRAFAHAPEWKASVAATWRHPSGWMARADLSGEAGFYFDTSNDQRADSRFLLNLRTGFDAGRWSVEAWVHNLFDERYPVRGFYFENEPPDFPTRLYLRWGDPRQAGVTARFSF